MRITSSGAGSPRLARALLGIVVMLEGATAQGDGRLPIPPSGEIAQARDTFHGLYPTLSQSRRKSDQLELARHALELVTTKDLPATDTFALLEEARTLAAATRAPGLAVQAACALGEQFELETVELVLATLQSIGPGRLQSSEAEMAVEHLIELAWSLREQGEHRSASALIPELSEMARRTERSSGLREEVDAVISVVARDQEYLGALAILREDPANELANIIVAEYSYSELGNTEGALQSLIPAGVDRVSSLAAQDMTLMGVDDNSADRLGSQHALADAWLACATNEDAPFRALAAERAEFWYSRALAGLSGLAEISASRNRDEARKIINTLRKGERTTASGQQHGSVERLVPGIAVSGSWAIQGEHIVQTELKKRPQMLVFGEDLDEYSFSFDARRDGGGHALKLVFHFQDAHNYRDFGIGNYYNAGSSATSTKDGAWQRDKQVFRKGGIEDNRWYNVRVDVSGAKAACYVDGELVCEAVDEDIASGCVGLATWETRATFRNLKLVSANGAVLASGLSTLDED